MSSPYEIRHARTDEVIGTHRTRQGALDGWRTKHVGTPVRIVRIYADGRQATVVEGTWLAE